MNQKLSLIIVNYHSADVLAHCLRSVYVATESSVEIILVDNSPDGGAERVLQQSGLRGHYFPQSKNIGYTRAANFGASHAVGEVICFLNPDTVLEGQALDQLLTWVERHPRTVVGPRELDGRGTIVTTVFPFVTRRAIWGANLLGKLPWPASIQSWLGWLIPRFRYVGLCRRADRAVAVPVLSGSCLMMTRSTWELVGPWEEALTYFGLESEWFTRARLAGVTAWYLPMATMFHEHAVSIHRAKPGEVSAEADRNRQWHAKQKGWLAVGGLAVVFAAERLLRRLTRP